MRTALRMAGATANAGAATAQNYAETTVAVVRYLVLYTYIWGLVLPLVLGPIGDWIGYPDLGFFPGGIGYLLVNFFWWVFEARVVAAVGFAHTAPDIFPEWIQKRAMKWSMREGVTYRFFKGSSLVGLWMPVLLIVPAEFPVWRYPVHYLGALCVAMSSTQFVATVEKVDLKFWRHVLGGFFVYFAMRHVLGFYGFDFSIGTMLVFLWNISTSSGSSFELTAESSANLIVGLVIIVVILSLANRKH